MKQSDFNKLTDVDFLIRICETYKKEGLSDIELKEIMETDSMKSRDQFFQKLDIVLDGLYQLKKFE